MALPPSLLARVGKKLRDTPLTFSLYIQNLIHRDIRHKVLPPRPRPEDVPPANPSQEE